MYDGKTVKIYIKKCQNKIVILWIEVEPMSNRSEFKDKKFKIYTFY